MSATCRRLSSTTPCTASSAGSSYSRIAGEISGQTWRMRTSSRRVACAISSVPSGRCLVSRSIGVRAFVQQHLHPFEPRWEWWAPRNLLVEESDDSDDDTQRADDGADDHH